jgi:O-antigen ligase/tetratricopeptide (TPR) repeat protein
VKIKKQLKNKAFILPLSFVWASILYALFNFGGVESTTQANLHLFVAITFIIHLICLALCNRSFHLSTLEWSALLLLLGIGLTTLGSQNSWHSLKWLMLFLDSILLGMVVLAWTDTRQSELFHFWMSVGLGSIVSFSAFFLAGRSEGTWVIHGPLINHNHLAGIIELLIFLPLVYAVFSFQTWRRLLLYPFFLMLITLGCTISRGGILSFLITVTLLAVTLSSRKRVRFNKVLPIALFIVTATALPFFLIRSLSVKPVAVSALMRTSVWESAWEIFKDFPILGSGLGTFEDLSLQYAAMDTTTYKAFYVHNEYLQFLSETGLVGGILLLFFLGLVFCHIITRWNLLKKSPIQMGALAGAICLLVHGWVDFNHHIPSNLFLFIVLMGVVLSPIHQSLDLTGQKTKMIRKFLMFLFAIIIIIPAWFVGQMQRTADNVQAFMDTSPTREEAVKQLQEALKHDPLNPNHYRELGRLNRQNGNLNNSLQRLVIATQLDCHNPDGFMEIARTWEKLQQFEKAQVAWSQALKLNPNNLNLKRLNADFLLRNQRIIKAIYQYKEILDKNPEQFPAIFGILSTSTADLLLIKNVIPNEIRAFELWTHFLERKKEYDLALNESLRAQQQFSLCPTPFLSRAFRIQLAQKKFSEAKELLGQLKKQCPIQDTLPLKVELMTLNGEPKEALQVLYDALHKNPNRITFLPTMKRIAFQHNQVDLLLTLLNNLAQENERRSIFLFELSNLYARLKENRKAIDLARRAVLLDVRDRSLKLHLVNLYIQEQMYWQATNLLTEMLELDPQDIGVRLQLARLFHKLGNRTKAIDLLQQGVRLAPKKQRILELLKEIEQE